ncbi:MAG: hypothetical protein CVU81_03475 [Euryarchaeota archaeon HGW-Euryarchaeota-1]|nr:MAG: hypothetical protein CVU81_03475 [Euryarchaeota archaeon HGW-Euryarchaeota-1]
MGKELILDIDGLKVLVEQPIIDNSNPNLQNISITNTDDIFLRNVEKGVKIINDDLQRIVGYKHIHWIVKRRNGIENPLFKQVGDEMFARIKMLEDEINRLKIENSSLRSQAIITDRDVANRISASKKLTSRSTNDEEMRRRMGHTPFMGGRDYE